MVLNCVIVTNKNMEEKYTYRLLTYCDPRKVCEAISQYDEMGFDVVALIPNCNGQEYTLFLKHKD